MAGITFISAMAENANATYQGLADHLTRRVGVPVHFVQDGNWQQRIRALQEGQVDMGVICGLPYVQWADAASSTIELLAAPVARGSRYGGRPVYFSDVVVRRDSPFGTFADLRDTTWAFNEPNSHSGYSLTAYHLAMLGETLGYFGRVVEAGAHQAALRMVLDGTVEASSIDSYVLGIELARHPLLRPQIRIVETLGPSPAPPLVVRRELPAALKSRLRDAVLGLHEDADGAGILRRGRLLRFAAVEDVDYDPIRRMAWLGCDVPLQRRRIEDAA